MDFPSDIIKIDIKRDEQKMLKGIPELLSPDLLKILCEMGHGDEIVIADAHFPGHSLCRNIIRADGTNAADVLNAVMHVFVLDDYVPYSAIMMAPVDGDHIDADLFQCYTTILKEHNSREVVIEYLDRFAFYERASKVFSIIITGEKRKYGNILLKKGVIK